MTNVSPKRSIENRQCALYGLFKNLSSLIQRIRCKTKTNYELVTCICLSLASVVCIYLLCVLIGSLRLWCCDLSLHVIPHSLYKTCAQGIMVLVTNIAHQVSKRGIYKRPALRCLAAMYAITMIPARKSSRGNASLLWFWGKDLSVSIFSPQRCYRRWFLSHLVLVVQCYFCGDVIYRGNLGELCFWWVRKFHL